MGQHRGNEEDRLALPFMVDMIFCFRNIVVSYITSLHVVDLLRSRLTKGSVSYSVKVTMFYAWAV